MDKQEREQLREIAKRATPGLWIHAAQREGNEVYAVVEPANWKESHGIATCGVYDGKLARSMELARNNKNATYIAAARAEKVLELLDMLDRYEDAINQKCTDCPGRRAGMCEGCALEGVVHG